jgi:hypothetical protein
MVPDFRAFPPEQSSASSTDPRQTIPSSALSVIIDGYSCLGRTFASAVKRSLLDCITFNDYESRRASLPHGFNLALCSVNQPLWDIEKPSSLSIAKRLDHITHPRLRRVSAMKNLYVASTIFLLGAALVTAQGRGHGSAGRPPASTTGSVHSNAPSGTPAASGDRDSGHTRAEDVGKGEKKGFQKNKRQSKSKSSTKNRPHD